MATNGWVRVAKGIQLVATDGASRIASAVVSSNIATKHLPELSNSILKAGGNYAQATVQTMTMKDSIKVQTQRTGGGGGQLYNGSASPEQDDDALVGPDGGAKPHATYSTVANRGLDGSIDKASHVSSERDGNAESTSSIIQNGSQLDNTEKKDNMMPTSPTATTDNHHVEVEDSSEEHHLRPHLPEGSAVPTTRLSRAFGFASLGAGLAMGTAAELARRAFGASQTTPGSSGESLLLSNDANAQRLSESLRRMRGAAMKLGQMLSIQDESIAPLALTNALAQVRKGAEAMPQHQLLGQLEEQWGGDWKERIALEERPFAAASIGQVHRGTLLSPALVSGMTKVAVKVQYPGVADSIESDLSNLSMLVNATGLAPPGLFLDNVVRVGREELKMECDYRRELENQRRFHALIASDPSLVADRFVVPQVIEDLSTERILVTELVHGGTIDKVVNLDQAERDRIGKAILRLTMLEVFVWRFMQTDPNWGNFLYDVHTRTTSLIDFGAAREYDEDFVRGYLNIVVANADQDEAALMRESVRLGFLTGDENGPMLEAHKASGFCLGEPFRSYEPYDFKASRITSRIAEHGSVFLKHRLTPPPEEVYTLHRKLAGAYNLCIKLGANIVCRDLLDEVVAHQNAKETTPR